MDSRIKYIAAVIAAAGFMIAAYFYPAQIFIYFVVGWLSIIPAAFIVYMVYGFMEYVKERKHRIEVTVRPTEAMKAIARREEELRREKERILYEELHKRAKE